MTAQPAYRPATRRAHKGDPMTPSDFPQANRTLGAPQGMTNCSALRVFTDGEHCISAWRPSWRERLAVLCGRPVWLWVVSGETQPPVMVETQPPWSEQP
jgi:hypothetical protein